MSREATRTLMDNLNIIGEALIGAASIVTGVYQIRNRGITYYVPRLIKRSLEQHKTLDLTGGILLWVFGLAMIIKALVDLS